jgi:hypothetical protein
MKTSSRYWKLALLVSASAALAALIAGAHPGTAARFGSDGNRLEASFDESAVSITNRIADLGIFQLINAGTGTLEGFGPATMVLSLTQDRSVHPCGAGSWTNAGIRRVTVAAGVLVIRELAYVCPTAAGPMASGRWTIDGPSSTGIFAGARGSGEGTVNITAGKSMLSGKLHLAS